MAASLNLSRSSPFGPLSDINSRRTFAYLIATLNASHPDYDFSHVLRPTDFHRERSLRRVIASIDNTLNNVRPLSSSLLSPNTSTSYRAYASSPSAALSASSAISSPAWGPHMWAMVDKEMKLKDCTCFAYQPAEDPFDGEEAAIWRLHYFFFNKALKRVAYLYVRGIPVVVHSPALAPHGVRRGSGSLAKRQALSNLDSSGANKRAKYWLGDNMAERVEDFEDEEDYDDELMWDPDEDVDIDPLNQPSSREPSDDEFIQSENEDEDEEHDPDDAHSDEIARSPIRGVSEDIAARMEV